MINTFIMLVTMYVCSYLSLDKFDTTKEDPNMIHYFGIFIVLDIIMILVSLYGISKVKAKSRELIENERFKEYGQEAELAL